MPGYVQHSPNISLNIFVYLVTFPWKLWFYRVVLVLYGPTCPKFSEVISHQYLWKGLSNFDFLQVVICILLDMH